MFNFKSDMVDVFRIAFIAALLSYLFVYGFEVTHFTLSIDEEPLDNFLQTLSAGRWGHALLRHYILPEPYAPFFTTIFSLIVLSLSAAASAIYLKLNKIESATFVIMLASLPQFAYQLEFSNQADTVSLSFLFSVLALLTLEKFSIQRAFIFIALTIASLAVYQSVFLYAATLLCIKLTLDAIKNETTYADVFKRIGFFCLLIIFSLFINAFLSKWIAAFFHVSISNYLSSMIGWGKKDAYDVIKGVLFFIRDYLRFKAAYGINAFPFTLAFLAVIIFNCIKRKINISLVILLSFATLLSGFLLNFAIGSGMPPRAMTQIPLVFAGLFLAALMLTKNKVIGLIIPIVFLCVGAAASNKLFYSDYMARQADESFSNQLIAAIYDKYPEFDAEKNPVYFYGSYTPANPWKIPTADIFGSSFFDWDGGNNRRMYMYLSTANLIKFSEPNNAQIEQSIEVARKMKHWPNRDSILMFDNVIIVKLSDKLSPYNR